MPWFQNPEAWVRALVSALLMFYTPMGLVYGFLCKADRILTPFIRILDAINRVYSVTCSGMEVAAAQYATGMHPQMTKFTAMMIGGMLMGCGGTFLWELFSPQNSRWHFRMPASIQQPSASMIHCFAVALVYYFLTARVAMEKDAALGLLIALTICVEIFRMLRLCCCSKVCLLIKSQEDEKEGGCSDAECCTSETSTTDSKKRTTGRLRSLKKQ